MGRVFEKRKHKMFARYAKMSRTFTKIGKEIAIAIKAGNGNGDPDSNARLRAVIGNAKAINMPKVNIDAAISRATTKQDKDFEEVDNLGSTTRISASDFKALVIYTVADEES
jgi:transcriptional/translational regulatory protein YebC/TACO1